MLFPQTILRKSSEIPEFRARELRFGPRIAFSMGNSTAASFLPVFAPKVVLRIKSHYITFEGGEPGGANNLARRDLAPGGPIVMRFWHNVADINDQKLGKTCGEMLWLETEKIAAEKAMVVHNSGKKFMTNFTKCLFLAQLYEMSFSFSFVVLCFCSATPESAFWLF